MNNDKFRRSVTDEEEVIFEISNATVKEAVQRWEKEWKGNVIDKMSMTSIPLHNTKYDDSNDNDADADADSTDGINEREYQDEYDDDDEDNDQSFEEECHVLARSETLLTEELSRVDSLSPLSQKNEESPPRRPDPPASILTDEEAFYANQRQRSRFFGALSIQDRKARFTPLPQNNQKEDDISDWNEDENDGAVRGKNDPPYVDDSSTVSHQRQRRKFHQQSWFQPFICSRSVASSKPRRRCRSCRAFVRRLRRYCRRVTVMRPLCILFSTALLVLTVLLSLTRRPGEQDLKSKSLQIVDVLSAHGISTRENLETFGTPQYRAVEWVVQDQSQQTSYWWTNILLRSSQILSSDALDRYLLAVLYYSMGGEQWPKELQFLSSRHVCHWRTQRQDDEDDDLSTTVILGVEQCQKDDSDVLVPTGIALAFDGLSGTIPDEIQHLSNLESLRIENNFAMGGSLPLSLQKLTHLTALALRSCSISGSLPSWIGMLTALETLALSDQRLRRSIPREIGQLTNLQVLELNGNLLSGSLELLGPLSNLRVLKVQDNVLSGQLNDFFLSNWTRLQEWDASENEISGTLPESFFPHATLKRIDLHGNRLSGCIPSVDVESNASLQTLRLHSNQLEGSIPSTISRLVALEDLDLSMNMLTGTMPQHFSSLPRLHSLTLGDNDFMASTISESILLMSSLKRLSLARASLTGTVSDSIRFLSDLEVLDLGGNHLTGTLPDALVYLTQLSQLSFRYNALSGTLPEKLDRLTKLHTVLLEGNYLTGTADSICQPTTMQPLVNISWFSSDCDDAWNASLESIDLDLLNTDNATVPDFQCSCCNLCCGENGVECSVDADSGL